MAFSLTSSGVKRIVGRLHSDMAQIVRCALKECLMKDLTIDELWRTTPPAKGVFEPESILGLPATAQRYLRHAI